ncbi:MAG TPA: ROK family protein [Euzebyales bacterium]|nr:ROK family protein [Euzebyales bacterium]
MRAVGVDVGGTKVRAGLVDGAGTIIDQERTATPEDCAQRLKAIVDLVTEVVARTGASGVPVGVGAAGLVDLAGVVRYAPNLDWRDAPLQDDLADALGVAVRVENDAAAAAWGEYRVGAAQHASGGALMLTVGTGVGGGLIMDDRLVRGATGVGGEFGHIIVAEGGPRCPCGNRGCLEALASGSAIGRMARTAVADREAPDSALYDVGEVTGTAVTRAAQEGDVLAGRILARAGTWLGVGIASLVNGLDPEVVLIGGGVLAAGVLLLDPAVEAYHARVVARGHRTVPPVLRAELGDDAGLIGAALLAGAA